MENTTKDVSAYGLENLNTFRGLHALVGTNCYMGYVCAVAYSGARATGLSPESSPSVSACQSLP